MDIEDSIDAKLDRALEMTFPASDPFTMILTEIEVDDEGRARRPEIRNRSSAPILTR